MKIFFTLNDYNRANIKKSFRIIEIKDKLAEKDNNVLINYEFMGELQCELQIMLQSSSSSKKEEMYNDYNHFLY